MAWISVGIVLISVSGANTSTERTPPPSKLFYITFIMQVTEPNDDYYNEFFLQDVRKPNVLFSLCIHPCKKLILQNKIMLREKNVKTV